uniref:Uncharacterized protein n=1 Tax=Oryza meridionalis TaxID=40149 RepID=A0A0E0F7I0_9ORYZ
MVIEGKRFSLDCPVPWLTFKEGTMPILEYLQLNICSVPMNQVNAFPLGLANLRSITDSRRHPDGLINLVINGKQEDIEALDEACGGREGN